MRRHPTRLGSSIRFSPMRWMTCALALLTLVSTRPVMAESDESDSSDASTAQRILLTGVDIVIVRPLAAFRAGLGSVLLVPAAILASPACLVNLANGADCRPVYEAPYEVLVAEPADYAFQRKMGEL